MAYTLNDIKREFDKWRENRKSKTAKMPEELLKLVSICARHYGHAMTQSTLQLSGTQVICALKKYSHLEEMILEKNTNDNLKNNQFKKDDLENFVEFEEVILKKENDFHKMPEENKDNFFNGKNKSALKEDMLFNNKDKSKLIGREIVFEVEKHKDGIRIKVYSHSDEVHKNILSAFI